MEDAFGRLPGSFVENLGQKEGEVGAFYSSGDGISMSLGPGRVAYGIDGGGDGDLTTFRVRFDGSSGRGPVGRGVLPCTMSFFRGNDPDGWVTGARTFREVTYPDLWPGIDLVYRFEGDRLKYDLEVEPGASPEAISMAYEGDVELSIDDGTGDLLARTPAGVVRDEAPTAYQLSGDGRTGVGCRFALDGRRVTYRVGDFDPSVALTIDPGLEFGTFFGRMTAIVEMRQDAAGNLHVCGSTFDHELPTSQGAFCQSYSGGWQDAFLAKFDKDLSNLLMFTFIGGEGSDYASSLAFDPSAGYLMTGYTVSRGMPVTSDAMQKSYQGGFVDAYLIWLDDKVTTNRYCSYVGGGGLESFWGLEVNSADEAWLGGSTTSTDFPTTSNAYMKSYQGGSMDCVIMRFSTSSRTFTYSSFLGTTKDEIAWDIRLDSSEHVVALCVANSHSFPVTSGAYDTSFNGGDGDIAVVRLHKDGDRILESTFLGGKGYEGAKELRIDGSGRIWVAGLTGSDDLFVTADALSSQHNGRDNDTILAQLSSDLSTLLYCSYMSPGYSPHDVQLALNATGGPMLAMLVEEGALCPSTAPYPEHQGGYDLYIPWIDLTAKRLVNATHLGGSDDDYEDFRDMLVAPDGTIILSGETSSRDFPVTDGAYDVSYNSTPATITGITMGVTPFTPPGPPANLTAVAGDGRAALSWEPPPGTPIWPGSGYRVYRGTDPDSMELEANVTEGTNHTVERLENGREYHFRVSALNIAGEGNRSEAVNATPWTLPLEPTNLTATAGLEEVHLSWDPPVDTGGRPLTDYTLHRGATSGLFDQEVYTGPEEGYTDTDLVAGRTYWYAVSAAHALAEGPMGEPVSAMPFGPPTEARDVKATGGDGRVVLSWREPERNGGSPVVGYQVHKGVSEDEVDLLMEVTDIKFTDDDVVNGVTYYYAVVARNEAGHGPRSQVVSATPRGLPTVATNLSVEGGLERIVIEWGPPENMGGHQLDHYTVYRGNTPDDVTKMRYSGKMTTFTDTEVRTGVYYYYQVVVVSGYGAGPATGPLGVKAFGLPSQPVSVQVTDGDGQVTIEWGPPADDGGRPITEYVISVVNDTAPQSVVLARVPSERLSFTARNLTNGEGYNFTVAAVSEVAQGPECDPVRGTPFGPPGAPGDLRAEGAQMRVTLTWTRVTEDGGRPVTKYVIYRGTDEQGLEVLLEMDPPVDGPSMTYTDREVDEEVGYWYAVAARNLAGIGVRSDPVSATTLAVPRPPSVPLEVTVEQDGSKVVIGWKVPAEVGTSDITTYLVYKGEDPENLIVIAQVEGGVLEYVDDTGLEGGRSYYYSVLAENKAGKGPASQTVRLEFEEEADGIPSFPMVLAMVALGVSSLVALTRRRRG